MQYEILVAEMKEMAKLIGDELDEDLCIYTKCGKDRWECKHPGYQRQKKSVKTKLKRKVCDIFSFLKR